MRRLIYALRPPALDELGLVPALRMQAERFPGLDVSVHAPDEIATLPAAVEVAAYRIATEALTNVSRHAAASTLHDHGRRQRPPRARGARRRCRHGARLAARRSGVASIRERAAELGGTCEVASAAGGGTRVFARLPLPAYVMRVLVADDHPLFRAGLLTALQLSDSVEVVAEASDGAEAVAATAALRPDVVVMDLHMPGLNGIEATRQIVAAQPRRRRARAEHARR